MHSSVVNFPFMSSRAFSLVVAELAICLMLLSLVQTLPADDLSRWRQTDARQRPLNELRRPRYRHRVHGLGWEIRSDRFVVWSRTNERDAQWTLPTLESAWEDMSELADPLTTIHRDPHFSIGPILVVIDNQPNRQRSHGATRPPAENNHRVIYVNVSKGQPPLKQQQIAIRRAAVRSFLQLTQLRLKLPTWVQDGFVRHVGEMRPSSGRNARTTATAAARRPRNRSSLEHSQSTWVPFLLTGKDAFYAPEFFDALRRTIAQVDAQRRGQYRIPTRQDTAGNRIVTSWQASLDANTPVDQLVNSTSIRDDFAAWTHDVDTGQPIFHPDPNADGQLLARQQEMILILKLAHRFHRRPETVVEHDAPPKDDRAGPESAAKDAGERKIDLLSLYDQLTNHNVWATLDVDGSLLLSSNTTRAEQILGRAEQRYRAVERGNNFVLQNQWDARTVLEVWLEQNPEDPRRPLARSDLKNPRSLQIVPPLSE